jgi:thioredoxin-like negative regulator of GroEL
MNILRLPAMIVCCALAVLPAHAATTAIAWRTVGAERDIDTAFAKARAENKPLFLYWGAQWCPPCNQVKATVFKRADFAAQSRSFVAVQLDGDSPSAQKLAARFKVRGYPTMILFDAQGRELTRLPGEVDAPLYLRSLQTALAGGKPIGDVLAAARRGDALSAAQWRQLAWHAWHSDESQLVKASDRTATLLQLARACEKTEPASATRMQLMAVGLAADDKAAQAALTDDAKFSAGATLLKFLGDGASAREQMDLVTNYAKDIVGTLSKPGTPERTQLAAAWDQAARRLQSDATLSRADRLGALLARVDLARLDDPHDDKAALPAPLVADVKTLVAAFDREITDGYERQSVITAAGDLLKRAGVLAESDALLKANLAKSHSPYYLMSQLAGNAKARGDKDEALQWYQRAWENAKGPATRIQWGAGYVNALVDLGPEQADRVERAASVMFGELAKTPDAFYERNARSLQRIGNKLVAWNAKGDQQARIDRLSKQLEPICAQLPAGDAQRATCDGLLAKRS